MSEVESGSWRLLREVVGGVLGGVKQRCVAAAPADPAAGSKQQG